MQQVEVFPHNLVLVGVLVAVPMNPQPLFLAPCPAQQEPRGNSSQPAASGASLATANHTVAPETSQWKKKKGENAKQNPVPILKKWQWGGQIAQFPMKRQLREALAAAEREKASVPR